MCKFFVVLLLATSCSPLYVPNTRNTPLFREQGEFQGTINVTTGLEGQLAYALSDNLAVMTNGSFFNQKITDQQEEYTRAHKYFEGGLGYYNVTRKYRSEIYVGYGAGEDTSFSQYYFFTPYFGQKDLVATGKYNRIFIQPTIGSNKRGFNMAFTLRMSMVDYTEFSSNDNNPALSVVTVKPDEKAHFFLEPALTGKFPLAGNLQGIVQLGVNAPLPNDAYFDYVPLQLSVGIQLNTGSLRTRVY